MEAIILAGGLGTRLRSVVPDLPKPMADINGKPFLSYLLKELSDSFFDKIILAVGYKSDFIQKYFGDSYENIPIVYSRELQPMGTGGAIKQAMRFCTEDYVFILNGDTFFRVDFNSLLDTCKKNDASIAVAVKYLENTGRYGRVIAEENRAVSFEEKKSSERGLINGGIYCVKKSLQELMPEGKFSFESKFLQNVDSSLNIAIYESEGYFIDIGVPEDYERAQSEFVNF